MAIKYGRINSSETSFVEQTFHKNQTLHSGSVGVRHVFAKKDDYNDQIAYVPTDSGSHWAFAHNMFYLSGSSKVNSDEQDKFNGIFHKFNEYNDLRPFHTNKFYDTASIFYIPQATFGERIKPGSFQLTARTGSISNTTKEIIIKDDKNGNLYGHNAHHSQSKDSVISSSDNYIGNIFYDLGVVVLTETASWSGSVNYTDINRVDKTLEQTYNHWTLKFNSSTPIFTSQYSVKVQASDFNVSMNSSTKPLLAVSGTLPANSTAKDVSNLRNELTASGWSPYFNQIQLFRNDNGEEPLLIANLPRSIRTRDDVDIIITFRIDH